MFKWSNLMLGFHTIANLVNFHLELSKILSINITISLLMTHTDLNHALESCVV